MSITFVDERLSNFDNNADRIDYVLTQVAEGNLDLRNRFVRSFKVEPVASGSDATRKNAT